jgi:HPt (histidine-containing phosphotransfer) domain-containing protein
VVRGLYDLVGQDRDALAEIVDAFLDEAPSRLAELRRGVDQGDAALAGRAAHTLKSNGSTFGAGELVSLCREMEAAARETALADVTDLIDRIERQWKLVRRDLAALSDRGPP